MQKVMADAILDHEKRTGKDSNECRPAKRPRVSQPTAEGELISDHACERDYEAIVQVFVDYGESIGDCDLESQWERIYAKVHLGVSQMCKGIQLTVLAMIDWPTLRNGGGLERLL